jgi:Notch-like protein
LEKSSIQSEKIATAFNKYFLSIADSIIHENNNHTNKEIVNPINYLVNTFSRPFNKINWKYATSYKIEKIIRSLKTKNTSGYNEISNRLIKSSSANIISPLTYICNTILNTGIFPERLKFAMVKPVFKKGKSDEISNYRPISLLTSFSKIIEKLMYTRLTTHTEANNLLVQEQYGFRSH